MGEKKPGASRRAVLIGGLAGGIAATIGVEPARATPAQMRAAIRNVVGAAPVKQGRVELDVPPLVENGNTVSLVVTVDSPMTATDYVKSIHVFNEKNPQPNVISVHLGARAEMNADDVWLRVLFVEDMDGLDVIGRGHRAVDRDDERHRVA